MLRTSQAYLSSTTLIAQAQRNSWGLGLGSQGLEVPWEMDLSGISWITTGFFGAELDKQGVGVKLCECGSAWPWVDGFSWDI